MATVGAYSPTDAQKAALLQTIATQGSAGQTAYQGEADAAQQAAQAAAAGAQQRSALIGAPQELTDELAASGQQAAAPYAADAAAGRNALSEFQGALKSGNAQFMGQLGDAQSLAKLITDAYQKQSEDTRAFNTDQARRDFIQHSQDREASDAQRKQAQEWAREQHQWDVENHQYELDKRKAAGTKDPFDSISNGEKATLLAYARQYAEGAHPGKMAKPGGKDYKLFGATIAHNPFGGEPRQNGRNKVTVSQALEQLNNDLGKPKGWVQAVLGKDSPDAPAKGAKKADVTKIRASGDYKKREALIVGDLQAAAGHNITAVKASLRNEITGSKWAKQHPFAAEQLLKDYNL